MIDPNTIELVRQKYTVLRPELDERTRRLWAAAEAVALGYGGVSAVARATGLARNTVAAGAYELTESEHVGSARVRRPGGGGKPLTVGVYDVTRNRGWVSVDHDTARFAVEALRRWWARVGMAGFPGAGGVLITADGGGSNGLRNRLWKVAL